MNLETFISRRMHAADLEWFQAASNFDRLVKLGSRLVPGGTHLSKTMMLSELNTILRAPALAADELRTQILEANVLGKRTGAARRQALKNLNGLYGILTPH